MRYSVTIKLRGTPVYETRVIEADYALKAVMTALKQALGGKSRWAFVSVNQIRELTDEGWKEVDYLRDKTAHKTGN